MLKILHADAYTMLGGKKQCWEEKTYRFPICNVQYYFENHPPIRNFNRCYYIKTIIIDLITAEDSNVNWVDKQIVCTIIHHILRYMFKNIADYTLVVLNVIVRLEGGKGKVFYDQELPRGELNNTVIMSQ